VLFCSLVIFGGGGLTYTLIGAGVVSAVAAPFRAQGSGASS